MRVVVGAVALVAAGGCMHEPELVVVPPPPGMSTRPFEGTPWYLTPPEPPLPEMAGVWDARLPVAGRVPSTRAWVGTDRLDRIRASLAEVDTLVVALRGERSPADVESLGRAAREVSGLVRERTDLVAEGDELTDVADRLRTARGPKRSRLLDRAGQLTDLIRLQIDATL
jgi:hypothetical protein